MFIVGLAWTTPARYQRKLKITIRVSTSGKAGQAVVVGAEHHRPAADQAQQRRRLVATGPEGLEQLGAGHGDGGQHEKHERRGSDGCRRRAARRQR